MFLFCVHLCNWWSVLLTQQSCGLLAPSTWNDSDVDPLEVVDMATQWRMKCLLVLKSIFMFSVQAMHANRSVYLFQM